MSKYQLLTKEYVIRGVEKIADNKELPLSDHERAILWSIIEILEETIAKEQTNDNTSTH